MMVRTSLVTLFVTLTFLGASVSPATAQRTSRFTTPSPSTTKMLTPTADASIVAQPSRPQRDSRLNGFLIGFVVGAVPGIMLGMGINTYCNNESSSDCPMAIPIVGGLTGLAGGGIGYAIDGAIHESRTLARPQPVPNLRFSFRF